jgi:hypothetical protein
MSGSMESTATPKTLEVAAWHFLTITILLPEFTLGASMRVLQTCGKRQATQNRTTTVPDTIHGPEKYDFLQGVL